MRPKVEDVRDREAIKRWLAEQVQKDDVLGGRAPGFRSVDRAQLSKDITKLYDRPATIEIEPLKYSSINHMLEWETHKAEFVRDLASSIIADAVYVDTQTIPGFEARYLPYRDQSPAGAVFSDILRNDAARAPLRTTMAFTRALEPNEVLLVEPGHEGSYFVGSSDARDEGPKIRVYTPSSAFRVGKPRPRVTKVIVQDASTIFDPERRIAPL